MNSPVRLGVSSAASTPTGFFQSQVLRLYPSLESWVARSVLLPSCSSWFIRTNVGLAGPPAAALLHILSALAVDVAFSLNT